MRYILLINLIFIIFTQHSLLYSQNSGTDNEQNKIIDSLKTELKSNIHDTIKLKILSDLNWIFSSTNAQLSKTYGFRELELSIKIGNKTWIAQSYNDIGISYYKLGLLDSALYNYNKSLTIRNSLNNNILVASSLSKIGTVYQEQGGFNKALDFNIRVLKIYEKEGTDNYVAMILNNVSAIYDKLNNFDKVIEYGEKALAIHLKNNNDYQAAFCYSNLASAYKVKGNIKKANDYLQKGLSIYIKYNDKSNEAAVLNSIAMNLRETKKNKEALEYYQKAYNLALQMNDKLSAALYGNNISGVQSDLGNYLLAEKYSLAALEYTERTNKYQLSVIYRQLSNLSAFLNNGKKAKYYLDKYVDIKDSIFNSESSGQLAEMETKYQTEKKQLQIENLEKSNNLKNSEIQKQKILIFSFIIGFIVIIIFSIIVYRLFIQKKKANILLEQQNIEIYQQKEEIQAQRDEIEGQRDLVTVQKEHIEEIHHNLTDSINYAKKIQEAMLPDLSSKPQAPNPKFQILSSKPQDLEFETWNLEFENFVLFRPKDVVSGDFYWFSQVNEYQIYAVADCTGHGVPGAFMSMLGISFLNEIVRKKEVTQASHVLDQLRVSIIESLKQTGESGTQKDGMDISLIVIKPQVQSSKFQGPSSKSQIPRPKSQASNSNYQDTNSQFQEESDKVGISTFLISSMNEVGSEAESANNQSSINNNQIYHAQWAGANNPLWLIRSQQLLIANNQPSIDNLIELKPDKMPIAVYVKMDNFTNHEIQLQTGDSIYLMSDGYEDQFGGPKVKKFLSKNLKELIIANCLLTMPEQKQVLENTLNKWIGNGEQIDDITLLGIKI